MKSALRWLSTGGVIVAGLIAVSPGFAQMVLISESRSVTVSYYGSGTETHCSAGTFGLFEASAVGIPFGGGYMVASQSSNITPSNVTIVHSAIDMYGPGGDALSSFELRFGLLENTRLTMTGYCNMWNGYVSLASDSLGAIPVIWHGGPNDPNNDWPNYLDFDEILVPGTYTLKSYETPRESVFTRIDIHAATVPDVGSSVALLMIGVLSLSVIRRGTT